MHRLFVVAALVAAMLAAAPVTNAASLSSGSGQSADASFSGKNFDTKRVLVQLKGDPLSTYSKTKPAHGKKVDFDSSTVKSYRALLSAQRNDFKQWLKQNAPKAKITGSWDLALNAVSVKLNGTKIGVIRKAPQAVAVQYEGLYHPLDNADPDLSLINAQAAWAEYGGAANAGEGVKVAIVDTGIDQTHPCFSDAGYPTQEQLGDNSFTNNKVIVAKVFNMKTPSRHYTPEALQDHGTHVAGTVACNLDTPVNVDGVAVPYDMSGVAPRALLGNYNIFPGEVDNARSEDIVDALEAAYEDGMQVANMSLGGGASGIQDLLGMAVNNLDQAGMISAVAAGNSGQGNAAPPHLLAPGHYTIESPGSAERALTAGASTVGHFIGIDVTNDTHAAAYAAAIGDFGPYGDVTAALSANQGTLCTPSGADLTGMIALINRGSCTFSTKVRNAQNQGAVAAIIVNNVYGPPIAMAQDGTANQPTIGAVSVSKSDQGALDAAAGDTFTIHSTPAYVADPNQSNYMAGFSSQGPTDVDFRVKPDVVAPGVNVLSSIPHQFCDNPPCFAFFQGTSMATPHLAGSAAIVIQQHPDWDAWQVRSAIVNTAAQGVLKNADNSAANDPNIIGSGLEDLDAAVQAVIALDPVSVSFGAVPGGKGATMTFDVDVVNLDGSAHQFDFSTTGSGGGVSYSVTSSLNLDSHASGTVTVTMTSTKSAAFGDHNGKLIVKIGSDEVAHAAVYTFIKN